MIHPRPRRPRAPSPPILLLLVVVFSFSFALPILVPQLLPPYRPLPGHARAVRSPQMVVVIGVIGIDAIVIGVQVWTLVGTISRFVVCVVLEFERGHGEEVLGLLVVVVLPRRRRRRRRRGLHEHFGVGEGVGRRFPILVRAVDRIVDHGVSHVGHLLGIVGEVFGVEHSPERPHRLLPTTRRGIDGECEIVVRATVEEGRAEFPPSNPLLHDRRRLRRRRRRLRRWAADASERNGHHGRGRRRIFPTTIMMMADRVREQCDDDRRKECDVAGGTGYAESESDAAAVAARRSIIAPRPKNFLLPIASAVLVRRRRRSSAYLSIVRFVARERGRPSPRPPARDAV
mmetsp:Transcript_2315/g.5706  ORF Transcript_2315/g.5706 Transcript_2315/m.5706 type:complete len:344 (-) Transcript_2315:75-1106(-)